MKYFIITIDTEGDNLWQYHSGDNVTTENSLYIPRFQELCEQFDFKPVWLTNYEMACDQRYVEYIRPKAERGLCEIGIHIHAWNNPPYYPLVNTLGGNPFLIEYPIDIMREKFRKTYELITSNFGSQPISHRAGRWVMNDSYFSLLKDFNIKIDCSYTPYISWEKTPGATVIGPNYSFVDRNAHFIGNLLEVPVTIRKFHLSKRGSWKHKLKTLFISDKVWLRPSSSSLSEMMRLCERVAKEPKTDYIEFMIHSSELMPYGSPYFKSPISIEQLYSTLIALFEYISSLGYQGATLQDYYNTKSSL